MMNGITEQCQQKRFAYSPPQTYELRTTAFIENVYR